MTTRRVVFHGISCWEPDRHQIAGWFDWPVLKNLPLYIVIPNFDIEHDSLWYGLPLVNVPSGCYELEGMHHYTLSADNHILLPASSYGIRNYPVPIILDHGRDIHAVIETAKDFYRDMEARDDVELY
jgi:hypothetical protein